MNILFIGIMLFIISVVIIELLMFAYRNMKVVRDKRIKKRIKKYLYAEDHTGTGTITKTRVMSDIPFLNQIILGTPGILKLDKLLLQANAPYPLGFYILLSLFSGVLGALLSGYVLHTNTVIAVIIGFGMTYVPYFRLKQRKEKRIEKFRSQFHEGLDMVARALRAGHAFTTAMKLAASEFEDPLGPEFQETVNEINFGLSVADALKNLSSRIECEEIKYFVIAVVIQRESGGNLAEVIEALAHVIRQKYSFQGKVRTLTAEARMSAIVLSALPFLIAGWIHLSNPDFLMPLFTHPMGRLLAVVGGVLMISGIFIMHRMVKIEV